MTLPRERHTHRQVVAVTSCHSAGSTAVGYSGEHSRSIQRANTRTGTDKRYVRRNTSGQFKESDDVGRSLAQDRRRKAKAKSVKGQGDRGDR